MLDPHGSRTLNPQSDNIKGWTAGMKELTLDGRWWWCQRVIIFCFTIGPGKLYAPCCVSPLPAGQHGWYQWCRSEPHLLHVTVTMLQRRQSNTRSKIFNVWNSNQIGWMFAHMLKSPLPFQIGTVVLFVQTWRGLFSATMWLKRFGKEWRSTITKNLQDLCWYVVRANFLAAFYLLYR